MKQQIIVIIDGTLSRLENGKETHAGKLFKLLLRLPPAERRIFYDAGVQGYGYQKWLHVASGTGLNLSIIKCYQKLSEHVQDGNDVYLFGYSRGAYAVRLISGMINRFGLLKPEHATIKRSEMALKLYAQGPNAKLSTALRRQFYRDCDDINFLGVWDTVKALGLQIPLFYNLTPFKIDFKDRSVSSCVRTARHALAYHEQRSIYEPELWVSASPNTDLSQVLFAGDHGVVGGNVYHQPEARKLGNHSFIWMMEQAIQVGLRVRDGWQSGFPTVAEGPLHDRLSAGDHIWRRRPRAFVPPEYFQKHPSLLEYEALTSVET